MKRRLLAIVSALSLLLCVATVALWVWSYQQTAHLGRWRERQQKQHVMWIVEDFSGVISRRGILAFASGKHRQTIAGFQWSGRTPPQDFCRRGWITDGPEWPIEGIEERRLAGLVYWGFTLSHTSDPTLESHESSFFGLPHWLVAVVFAACPAYVGIRFLAVDRVRRNRARAGLCLSCGYDLRASKDRCPECRTAITERAAS